MTHTQHFVTRYVRNGDELIELPPEEAPTAEEAMERGRLAAAQSAGVMVYSMSGDLSVALNITGLAEYGEIPDKIYF